MTPTGMPERHPDAFVLINRVKGQEMKAVCEVWQDASGWEARLLISGRYVLASTVGLLLSLMPAAGSDRRSARMPARRLLVGVADSQHRGLVERTAGELER